MRTFHLGGHVGADVSALVDGQLSAGDEERAWSHVLTCPGCRRLVEREGWTKTRLRTLSQPVGTPPSGLIGSLQGLYDLDAWSEVDRIERASMRRRTAAAVVGVGSIGCAVLGIVAMTTPPAGRGEVPGSPSPAMIRSDLIGSVVGNALATNIGAPTGATDSGRSTAR